MQTITRRERERQVRESEIIAAAERIFGEKGFEGASMDEIAAEAQFTKRTLYLYFADKEDLFFAAALRGFHALFDYLRTASEGGRTGYARLEKGGKAYFRFYREHPRTMRLIGEIGQVKKKARVGSERLQDLMKIDNGMFQWVAKSLEEGKADGSIRSGLDSLKTSFSVIFIMTGFFNQLSQTGGTFMEHFGLDPEEFCDYSMDLLFDSIRAKPGKQGN